MVETFKNAEYGIEAVVTEGNAQHSHRCIMRDVDADETIQVTFGNLDQCIAAANGFVHAK